MTAEVVIMNKSAVALAADSAVTIGDKIFNSANKVFMLSKHHPVGIMIYNNASLSGVPLETIIKLYRDEIGNKNFDTLKDFADDFIQFVEKSEFLFFPEKKQLDDFDYHCNKIFQVLVERIVKNVDKKIEENGKIESDFVKSTVKEVIHEYHEIIKSDEPIYLIAKGCISSLPRAIA